MPNERSVIEIITLSQFDIFFPLIHFTRQSTASSHSGKSSSPETQYKSKLREQPVGLDE